MHGRRPVLLISSMMMAACLSSCRQGTAASELPYSRRDSAGVQLVVAGGPARPDSFLRYEETLRIDGSTRASSEPFFNIWFVRVDDEGRIYTSDASYSVSVFESSGQWVRTVGRKGEGPGEFRTIIQLLVHGDTIAVNDLRLGRVTRFDQHGEVVDIQATRHNDQLLMLYGLGPDGWIARLQVRKPTRSGLARDTIVLRRVPSTQTAFDMAEQWKASTDGAAISLPTQLIHYYGNGSWRWGPLWTPEPSFSVDAGGRVYSSQGMNYAIDVHDASGKLVRRIMNAHEPVPITEQLLEEYADAVRAHPMTGPRMPAEQPGRPSDASELSRLSIPHADALPALGTLLAGPDGSLWIARPDLTPDPLALEVSGLARSQHYWDVIDSDGRYVGTVALPASFAPQASRGLTVYGIDRDEDDVQNVVAYTIAK